MKYLKLMVVFGFAIAISFSTYAQGAKYIGANGCKMCHNKPEKGAQHAQWLKTSHSQAYAKLDDAGKKKQSNRQDQRKFRGWTTVFIMGEAREQLHNPITAACACALKLRPVVLKPRF